MKLPNGERANLGDKLERYSLNAEHPIGRHKARVFASVLSITLENIGVLRAALLHAAVESDEAVSRGDAGHGKVFELCFYLRTEQRAALIASGLIIDPGTDFPRLTSCYILKAL